MQPLNSSGNWASLSNVPAHSFKCGHCGKQVATEKGWIYTFTTPGRTPYTEATIEVCPLCRNPTPFGGAAQIPGVPFGETVQHVPDEVRALYDEARTCTANGAYTAAVLAIRKLLMHIAVERGAEENKKFIEYVQYLADEGYVPPNGRGWVDHIRTKGNEANHEIALMNRGDAVDLINFTEMLLKFIYEFPSRVPAPPAPAAAP